MGTLMFATNYLLFRATFGNNFWCLTKGRNLHQGSPYCPNFDQNHHIEVSPDWWHGCWWLGHVTDCTTIPSDSISTTTTTRITKTIKGGLSETRIEKSIVIIGDADSDQDQVPSQAQREQYPTRRPQEWWCSKKRSWRKGKSTVKNSLLNNIPFSELEEFWPFQVVMPHW